MAGEIKVRLAFYKSFSTFCNIFGGLFTQVFYSWAWVSGDLKSSVAILANTHKIYSYK